MAYPTNYDEPTSTLTITLPERFSSSSPKDLKQCFSDTDHDINAIIIDFTQTSMIDSSGLGALLIIRQTAKLSSENIMLINVNTQILDVILLSHFDSLFTIK